MDRLHPPGRDPGTLPLRFRAAFYIIGPANQTERKRSTADAIPQWPREGSSQEGSFLPRLRSGSTFMKLLIFSDSHGSTDNMVRAVELEQAHTLDAIIHLGDGWRDAEELHRLYPRLPLEQVPGNCDLGRFEERERLVFFGTYRLLLCHGHTLGVKSSLLRAAYTAHERGAQALLFGHTHNPYIDYHDGLWLINPGSIGSYQRPTYCVLTDEGGQLSPSNRTLA